MPEAAVAVIEIAAAEPAAIVGEEVPA